MNVESKSSIFDNYLNITLTWFTWCLSNEITQKYKFSFKRVHSNTELNVRKYNFDRKFHIRHPIAHSAPFHGRLRHFWAGQIRSNLSYVDTDTDVGRQLLETPEHNRCSEEAATRGGWRWTRIPPNRVSPRSIISPLRSDSNLREPISADSEYYDEFLKCKRASCWSILIFALMCLPGFCTELEVSSSIWKSGFGPTNCYSFRGRAWRLREALRSRVCFPNS